MLSSFRISNLLSSARVILNIRSPVAGVTQSENYYVTTTRHTSKTIEEKLGLPVKPKKPLTPYFRFMKQIRPEIVASNPNITIPDTIRMIAQKWEKVDANTKKKFEEEYKKDQISFVEERAKYDSKLTDAQRMDIKQLKEEIAEAKDKRLHRKKVKELGKPRKPASAFLRYLAEQRQASPQTANETYKSWQKRISVVWMALSDKEKASYFRVSQADFEKYKLEITKWEEQMIKQGNLDVVRNEALIDAPPPKTRRPKTSKNE